MKNKTDNKKKLEGLTLYDHDLLLRVMDGNIPLAQQWVNSYFRKRSLKVIHIECEVMMFNFQAGGNHRMKKCVWKKPDPTHFVLLT